MEGDEAVHLVVDKLRGLLVFASEEGRGEAVPSRARVAVDDPEDKGGVGSLALANGMAGNNVTEGDVHCGLLPHKPDTHLGDGLLPHAVPLPVLHLVTDSKRGIAFPVRTGNDDVASHGALPDVIVVELQHLHLGLEVSNKGLLGLLINRSCVDLDDLAQMVDMVDDLVGEGDHPVEDDLGLLLGFRLVTKGQ